MRVNVSAVKTFQTCETDWYYAYHLRRVPRQPQTALLLGTLWHTMMEYLARTHDRDASKRQAVLQVAETTRDLHLDPSVSPLFIDSFHKDVEHLYDLFDAYEERFTADETLLVEEALEMPLLRDGIADSGHSVFGRPDRVVRMQGRLWHVQNRTLSDRTPMAVYLAAAERDLHELAYAALICHRYSIALEEYGGTFMNICRKVSRKALAERPQDAFVQEFVPIAPQQVRRALDDIIVVCDRMTEIAEGRRVPLQNRDSDKGKFGNRLSPYFNVKLGRDRLEDDRLFMNARSRYEDDVPVEAA